MVKQPWKTLDSWISEDVRTLVLSVLFFLNKNVSSVEEWVFFKYFSLEIYTILVLKAASICFPYKYMYVLNNIKLILLKLQELVS